MLYREIVAVCFHTHTKHMNTVCGQMESYLNVTAGSTSLGFKSPNIHVIWPH